MSLFLYFPIVYMANYRLDRVQVARRKQDRKGPCSYGIFSLMEEDKQEIK